MFTCIECVAGEVCGICHTHVVVEQEEHVGPVYRHRRSELTGRNCANCILETHWSTRSWSILLIPLQTCHIFTIYLAPLGEPQKKQH